MGSDQSKQSYDNRSSGAQRQNFRPRSPPSRPPQPMHTYRQPQRPAPAQTEPDRRLPQPYSYAQEELVANISLYPRLNHVITPLNPNQSPSQQNRQGISNPTRAEDGGQRGAYNAPTAQVTSCSASPAQTPAKLAPTAQAAAHISPTAQSAACSSPNAQAANTSRAAQKLAYTARDHSATCTSRLSPNIASVDGFTVIHSPKSATEPEAVIKPIAPQQSSGNRNKKQVPRKPRSRSRGAAAIVGEFNINCPTCDGQYTENIFQCGSGHSTCQRCKQHGVRCRLCRQPITDMRNFSLQEYVCEIKTPCYNAEEGCKLSFKIGDMGLHLRDCPFQEMECPLKSIFGICTWRGKMSQLVSHFDACHPESRQGNVDQEMLLPNVYYNEKYIYLIELGCYKFLVHLQVSEADRRVYITVQLIGTENSASNWTYDIHVYNKREPRRKYQFSDKCHPNGTSVEEIFKQAKCAVLPLPFAMTFINEGALNYKFFIKKEFESKKDARAKAWKNKYNRN